LKHIVYSGSLKIDTKRRDSLNTLLIKDNNHHRATKVNAKRIHQTKSGKWIAEVERKEFFNAFFDLCQGIRLYLRKSTRRSESR
jgi:hypothetical protein